MQKVGVMLESKMTDKETGKTRLLGEVIKRVQTNFENRFCENLTGWENLENYDIKIFSKHLSERTIKQIRETIKELKCNFETGKNPKSDDIKDEFRIAWNSKGLQFGQPENTLETLITLSLKDCNKFDRVVNQLYVPDGGHVDIYCEKDDECFLIELKQWKNCCNSPLYSIVEVLKNYYLMQEECFIDHYKQTNFKKINKINLFVLAPKEYYKDYNYSDDSVLNHSWQLLNSFMNNLIPQLKTKTKQKPQINIKLASIDFSNKDYEAFCKKIQKEIETEQGKKLKKGMKPINKLNLTNYLKYLSSMDREKLLNWQTILSTSSSDA